VTGLLASQPQPSIAALLAARADATPQRVAFTAPTGDTWMSWTWAEVADVARRAAACATRCTPTPSTASDPGRGRVPAVEPTVLGRQWTINVADWTAAHAPAASMVLTHTDGSPREEDTLTTQTLSQQNAMTFTRPSVPLPPIQSRD
jgi:hypothetical protein